MNTLRLKGLTQYYYGLTCNVCDEINLLLEPFAQYSFAFLWILKSAGCIGDQRVLIR
jgi:hypothetical protein